MNELALFLQLSVQLGTPFLFGTLGGILCEKVGNMNLGIEGMMMMGAFFGFMTGFNTTNPVVAVLVAMLGGALCILLQGVGRYLFYHGLALGVPLKQDALQVAGELLLALVPGLLLCLLIRKIHTKFEEVLEH